MKSRVKENSHLIKSEGQCAPEDKGWEFSFDRLSVSDTGRI